MNIYALELNNDIKGILQRKQYIEALIAKTSKPDLIILPELALCSYMGNSEVWQYADVDSVDTSKWAMKMAEKYHTYIAAGYLERNGNEYYNSYLIADRSKVYGIVRKIEGEPFIFKRGDFSHIIQMPFGNVAVAICYDARRKHFYEDIRDKVISLILFPHGSPSNPKDKEKEQKIIDYFCKAYQKAFGVPVVYANSKGRLDYMMGRTGKMMTNAGFCLNGMSAIYDNESIVRTVGSCGMINRLTTLTPQRKRADIMFFGEDIIKGNWIFRKFVQSDLQKGICYYEKNKARSKTNG